MFYVQCDDENKCLYPRNFSSIVNGYPCAFSPLSLASVVFSTLPWQCNEMSIHLNILLNTENTVLREIKELMAVVKLGTTSRNRSFSAVSLRCVLLSSGRWQCLLKECPLT